MTSFEETWNRVRRHAGEEFRTRTGLPFTYVVDGDAVVPSGTRYRLGRENFRTPLDNEVRGSSYVLAILTDPRIDEWPLPAKLFVYGTLAPGRVNAHVLEDVPGTWEPGRIHGRLFAEGWGAALGFPGVVLGEGGDVDGLLFTSDVLADHWQRLDAFEGDGYDRVETTVRLEDGRTEQAYVYVLRERPAGS